MKPILFNTDMVRAIEDNHKTVTRRIVKFPAGYNPKWTGYIPDGPVLYGSNNIPAVKAPYHPSDILYVRETWTKLWYVDPDGYTHFDQPMYYYAADGTPDITLCDEDGFELDDQRIRWRPSIHMPREAARIFLRVTDVRVERLRKITIDGMRMEGVNRRGFPGGCTCAWRTETCMREPCQNRDAYEYECWALSFIKVWNSTIKKADRALYDWDANPWVWVIEFERISKEEAMQHG